MPVGPLSPEAQRERLHRSAQALEALVLKQLVVASKAFTGGDSAGGAVRADMFADALADALVKGGGIGLARQIEQSVTGGPRSAAATGAHAATGSAAAGTSATGSAGAASRAAPPSPAELGPPEVHWSRRAEAPAAQATADEEGDEGAQVLPEGARVTSPFGLRHDPFDGHLTRHAGVDLAGAEGAPIRAASAGVVRRAGELGGYGQAVEIDHGDGVTTLYGHASELLVAEGDRVEAGQTIARVGHTGRATGPHLHFEVRQGGRAVDPSRALKIYGRRADEVIGSGS